MSYLSLKKHKQKKDKFFGEKRYSLSVFGLSPQTDWKIIITIFVILFVFVSFVGYSLNSDILDITKSDSEHGEKTENLVDMKKLDEIISTFESRLDFSDKTTED